MNTTPFPIQEIPNPALAIPVVLSVPHSGTRTPAGAHAIYAQDPDTLAQLGDLYVDDLFADAAAQGVTVVRTPFSRFFVDLNRFADDLSPDAVENARIHHQSGYHGKRGAVWAVSPHGHPMYHQPLSKQTAAHRLRHYYYPYYEALRHHLLALRERFGYAILLDGHSMPSRTLHLRGRPRADIVPGDLDGRSCAPELSQLTRHWWEDAGYSVQPNHPYRGGAITRGHGHPEQDIHAIQIEFNRGLYMDETTRAKSDGFAHLQADCTRFVQALRQLDLSCRSAAE